jgi:hypothetical protein
MCRHMTLNGFGNLSKNVSKFVLHTFYQIMTPTPLLLGPNRNKEKEYY